MFILAFLLSFTLQAAEVSKAPELAGTYYMPYEDRLIGLLELSEFVPGYSEMSYKGRNLGALGGLYVQTEWQLRTGRDKIPAWRYFNYHLVVEPHTYFQDYLKDGPRACLKYRKANLPKNIISKESVCTAWLRYFVFTDNRKHHNVEPTLALKQFSNKLLWQAHDIVIDYALQKYPRVFADMSHAIERDYLKGWFKFVHVLAKTQLPTPELFIRLLAKPSSPQCSPLGAPGCQLADLPATSRIFVIQMMNYGKN